MAKFLDTTGISYHLEQIIKRSDERLILISPFLKINDRIKELLEDKDRLKIDMRVIYGKNELQPEENNWLISMGSIRSSFCKNLHAKCYMNEKEALITSMNLYDFSQANNNEMGIFVLKEEDPELFDDIYKEAQRLVRISDELQVSVQKIKIDPKKSKGMSFKREKNERGFCIRTGVKIPFNIERPFSYEAFQIWSQYGDPDYPENYCHYSGEKSNGETSFDRPILNKNWKKAQKYIGEDLPF
jgi:hypothetical protein